MADLQRFLIIGVLERSGTHADEQAFVPAGFLRENYRTVRRRDSQVGARPELADTL